MVEATVQAGIELALDGDRIQQGAEGLPQRMPVFRTLTGSDVMPSSGVAVIVLGQCPGGRIWDVRRLSISAADPSSVVSNATAMVFASRNLPAHGAATGTLDAGSLVATTTTIASVFTLNKQIVLYSGQWLFVAVSGATQNTNLVSSALVIARPEDMPVEVDV